MREILITTMLIIALTACSGNNTPTATPTQSKENIKNNDSTLTKFLDEDKICDIVSINNIQKLFKTTAEITANSSSFRKNNTCDYSWDRADAKQREEKVLSTMMNQTHAKAKRLSMRERVMQHNFNVTLSEFKGNAQYFVPKKLTEEQLNQQIAEAKKRAAERLSDEQKSIAGDMANAMMESMLRKNNENVEIKGIGQAAYWSSVGGGGLSVLVGNIKLYIAPIIADTLDEDRNNAEKIAEMILQ